MDGNNQNEKCSRGTDLALHELESKAMEALTSTSSVPASDVLLKDSKGAVKKKTTNSSKFKSIDSPQNASEKKSGKSKGNKFIKEKRMGDSNVSSPLNRKTPERFASSENSNLYSDVSIKMNSSGNMRSSKKTNRFSAPNFPAQSQDRSFMQDTSSPRSKNSKASDKKNNKYRSKTPECQSTPDKPKQSVKKSNSFKRNLKFEPYIPLFQVQQGLKRGEFIEGAMRINPRSYEDAYVNAPDGKMDIYIGGMHNRNRALNGDIVAVQINPKQEWRVLCDAIKDYEERSGECIMDTICTPIPSPPCKIHTPDKLSRSRPVSSNSWGSSYGDRQPDTVKILGIDKLASQLGDLSINPKGSSKDKPKRKLKGFGAAYSQESSEDCLDKTSPNLDEGTPPIQAGAQSVGASSQNQEQCDVNSQEKLYPACDMHDIGTFDTEFVPGTDNSIAWEREESSLNIVVSPVELLSIDGNSLLDTQNVYGNDDSETEFNGIIVPPGDLSGDEFTDSASIDSTESQHTDQVLEDAAFLACQQDADNNNMVYDNINIPVNVINNFNSTDFPAFSVPPSSTALRENSLDCKLQQNKVINPVSVVEMSSESVVCSALSELSIPKNRTSSEEDVNNQPLVIGHFSMPGNEQEVEETAGEFKKQKQRRRKKKKNKDKKEVHNDVNSNTTNATTPKLTVDDIMRHPEWPKFIQKTGKVVCILERTHSCVVAGQLKLCPDKNPKWALFSPNDSRVPRIMVPMSDCPQNFYHRPNDYTNVLFLAKISEWNESSTFAAGRIIKSLGNAGDIAVETEGILVENDVEYGDFPPEVLKCLPQDENWSIPAREIKNRRDLRKECVFTIDPASARDMDDAVSCIALDNGNFEIGVHIADVTYFVHPDTALDEFAKSRSTSVYLVQKVIPMLPRLLCDNLCSLTPGQDRLTYSVIWELSPEGEICKQWIGRSIIHSCCKLSYEHAQSMLENPGKQDWTGLEFPAIFGGFPLDDIATSVYRLHQVASRIRERRFCNGALRLDQVKLQFTLDEGSGLPLGFNVFTHKDSNKLIEEFMLLANMSVARKIYESFPALSLLRRHPPPQQKVMDSIVSMCESLGVILDSSTSGSLQSSISRYAGNDSLSDAKIQLLMTLCSKPMNCALYFCTGVFEDPAIYHHYALNVPLYTHFTSPIRRYPDVLVHRLLGAALEYNPCPKMTAKEMHKCADHCNAKKYNAKKVSDQSGEMFLAAFVKEMGSVHAKGVVVDVRDHSFDCLVLEMGVVKRVYCDKLPLLSKQYTRSHGVSQLKIFWKGPAMHDVVEQVLVTFALVDVIVTVDKGTLKMRVTLQSPGC